jgi:hypothetical protein
MTAAAPSPGTETWKRCASKHVFDWIEAEANGVEMDATLQHGAEVSVQYGHLADALIKDQEGGRCSGTSLLEVLRGPSPRLFTSGLNLHLACAHKNGSVCSLLRKEMIRM